MNIMDTINMGLKNSSIPPKVVISYNKWFMSIALYVILATNDF